MVAHVVRGSDPSLVSRALSDLLAELTGGRPGPGGVEQFEPAEAAGEAGQRASFDITPVLGALSTPSLLGERRVVVVRRAGTLTSAQAAELAKLVAEPASDNVLVLAAAGKDVPAVLSKAASSSGGRTISTDPPRTARQRAEWLEERTRRSSVQLDAGARARLLSHVGEDGALVDPILELAAATYGGGARLSELELEPLLSSAGGAPPWELTDAIDAGDVERAVTVLRRMLRSGRWAPLQVLATLHRHAAALLRLDGATDVSGPDDAARVLRMSPFPAKKVLEQARRLGHGGAARAVTLVADADADMRGRSGWPDELVLEVAVARLAQLSRPARRPGGRPGRRVERARGRP